MKTRSIGILTLLNIVGAVIGVGQSVVVAYYFGTSRGIEIFFAAMAVETSILHLTQTGQLTEIFLPTYHRVKHEQGAEAAHACFAVMLNIMLVAVVALAGAMYFFAPWLVRLRVPGFSADELATTTLVFQALLPLLLIHVASAMLKTLANAEKWFGLPEALAIVGRIMGVIVLVATASSWGVWALVAGMYVNNGVAVIALAVLALRLGYRHHLRFRQRGFAAFAMIRQLSTTFIYVIATQCFAFAFDAGLSRLPQGVFAVFKYVQQHLLSKTTGLLLRPVNVVFYTHFSEAIARRSTECIPLIRRALNLTLAACVLACVAFFAAGEPLLQGLWGGRNFSSDEITLAWRFACLMYLLLIVTGVGQIYRRVAMSLGMVRGFYVACSLVQFACAGLALWLLPVFGIYGAFTIVIANRLGLALVPMALLLVERRDLLRFCSPAEIGRWLLAALAGIAVAIVITRIGAFDAAALGRIESLMWAMLNSSSAVLTTVASAWLVGVAEVRQALAKVVTVTRSLSARHG